MYVACSAVCSSPQIRDIDKPGWGRSSKILLENGYILSNGNSLLPDQRTLYNESWKTEIILKTGGKLKVRVCKGWDRVRQH